MHTAKVVVHEVDCPDLVGDAKTTHWQSRVWRFAPSVLGLAVSCSLGAQSRPEGPALPEALAERLIVASNSIDPVEAGSQLDRLVSRLHNSSSLLRVQTI